MTTTQKTYRSETVAKNAAKRAAIRQGRPTFVFQISPDTFNYTFAEHDDVSSVLIARFDKNGNSF